MKPKAHDIALIYEDQVPEALFNEFRAAVAVEGLDLHVEARPTSGPLAGMEWVMPTAVMLFIGKSYFDGFLGEMGKDHYQALKSALKTMRERFSLVKATMVGTAGKVAKTQPYSLFYSIWFDGGPDRTFKFLVPHDIEAAEADRAMDVFLDFLEAYYAGRLPPGQAQRLASARTFGRVVLIAYDSKANGIELVDPMSRGFIPE